MIIEIYFVLSHFPMKNRGGEFNFIGFVSTGMRKKFKCYLRRVFKLNVIKFEQNSVINFVQIF